MFTQTPLVSVLHFFPLFSGRINWDNKTVFHEIKEDYLLFDIFDDEEVDDDSCLPSLNLRSLSNIETEEYVVPPVPALT